MANGFGAAFGGLLLLAVVAGLAGLLALSVAGAVLSSSRGGSVPRGLRYLAAALVVGVVLVAGFAVAALVDEAPPVAAVFVATVFVPLGAVGGYLHRTCDVSGVDTVAATGLAWGGPFLIGVAVTFGVPTLISRVFNLSTGEFRQLGLQWLGTVLGGTAVLLGALRLASYLRKSVLSRADLP